MFYGYHALHCKSRFMALKRNVINQQMIQIGVKYHVITKNMHFVGTGLTILKLNFSIIMARKQNFLEYKR